MDRAGPLTAPLRHARRPGVALALAVALVGLAGACGDDGPTADPEAFCQRLDRLASNDPFEAFGDVATPAQMETAFQALVERAGELVAVAPDRARPAAQEYETAVVELDRLLAEAGYAPSVDADTYTQLQVDYTEAAQRLERYLTAEC